MAKSTDKSKPAPEEIMEQPAVTEVKIQSSRAARRKEESIQQEEEKIQISIEKKLISLYSLQQIDSQIDKIRIVRGELPLEVEDLEDEIAGLQTRVNNFLQEMESLEKSITEKKLAIKDSQALIKKYEEQQMNVRNNREYDSLTKEVDYQGLEIQLAEKRIREFQSQLDAHKALVDQAQVELQDRQHDLETKKAELEDIVEETQKEEQELVQRSEEYQGFIEDRLILAYQRIRKNARNGLAVVHVERDACGGCFNKIPPQHQLEIRMHKKIIVCEYCGRILVDDAIAKAVQGI